ncbi:hypothetical protein Dpoa2040_002153 [Dickeya sp. CFBP 2040]|uniref:Uncharacterized protein n=1 Tax=Dickeya poaceiphila TaxID=568768 RepID=A0A5B8I711_9GAMM|nr:MULTISPECIES: hypothetical protein [Dickeya]NKI74871.1 hypothetical protein [Dickeya sp. CFBP 2040]QDX30234.1 hypothetical protein Dpoa569_0002103 [Dickeya poaceiphila]
MGQSVVFEPVPAGWCCKRSNKDATLAGFVSGGIFAAHAHLGYGDIVRPSISDYLKHRRTTLSLTADSWLMVAVGSGGLRHDN